ncbi:uncharacterized protein HRG_09336 [Hirsutella rhossiliensis]|uniref:Uncharacterized protein n=1 Tax=Hirsutella rhossiliensis TaxID=111463 RepID=A0A9P8SEZ7_9HYPO|nr:uncharacterized protein HRG_09336 [Hirsutella rhossiliensis]KAH0959554.1 hypothetical protein HRG_09336 [Hirsutella rhossiliensis]
MFSTLFDAIRARTVWLVSPASTLAALAIASVVAKAVVLVLESHEKSNSIIAPKEAYGPESTSSVLNRSIFFWLNRVVWNVAVATGAYWYHHYRVLTMIRGCLVSAIGWQTLRINIYAMSDPKAPVTLMSTDVKRILFGLRSFHEF